MWMNRISVCVFAGLSVLCGGQALAGPPLVDKVEQAYSVFNNVFEPALANPALAVYRHDFTLNSVAAGFRSNVDGRRALMDADSYIRLDSTDVVSATGQYSVGFHYPRCTAESADMDIVWPYALADTVGGRQNIEVYGFSLGFSRGGKAVGWGAGGSYRALQSYRDRDPRPRNVSGLMRLEVGLEWKAWERYGISASAGMMLYKQTSSITFYSELGEDVVYHLTGPGTSYTRFNSLGKNTAYKGGGFCFSAGIFPRDAVGFYSVIRYGRMDINYILRDLNNLTMSALVHRRLRIDGGWRSGRRGACLGVGAYVSYDTRDGRENIFGDPSTGIYPRIGTLGMFRARVLSCGLSVAGEGMCTRRTTFNAEARCGYTGSYRQYAVPLRRLCAGSLHCEACPGLLWRCSCAMMVHFKVVCGGRISIHSCMTGFDVLEDFLSADCVRVFERDTRTAGQAGVRLGIDRTFGGGTVWGLLFSAVRDTADGMYIHAAAKVSF